MVDVQSGGRVVVGVNGSSDSLLALEFAYDEARARGVGLLVVGVVKLPSDWANYYGLPVTEPKKRLTDVLERKLRSSVQRTLGERMGAGGPDVQVAVYGGSPASTLTSVAEGSPLLVVGTRGLDGFRRMMLGSVSLLCVLHAPCPVAVVRPSAQHVEEPSDERATVTPTAFQTKVGSGCSSRR